MIAYIVRRLLITIPILFGILLVTFVLMQMLPGDPAAALMSPEIGVRSPEYVARRRAELGLDSPVMVQFGAWVRELLQGNLGYSFHQRVPVTEMIGDRIGSTILLASVGLGLALLISVPVGVIAALKQNSWLDHAAAAGSMLAISIPTFFFALAAIYVFAVALGVLPSGGMRTVTATEVTLGDSIRHLVLPAGVMAVNLAGPIVRFVRQGMLEALRQDYITTARAKGVPRPGVIVGHGLRTALIPLTTVLGIMIPGLLTGVLVIEIVFSWPGLGFLAFESIRFRDYPVITAMVLIGAVLVMLFNLLADLVAAMLDPRIRL